MLQNTFISFFVISRWNPKYTGANVKGLDDHMILDE
jgi:hypothetical protein